MKTCSKCKVEKPESEFYKNRRHKDGLAYYCKGCSDASTEQYRLDNPEKLHADYRRHNERRKRDHTPEKCRADHLRHKFGMSSSDYQKLLDRQGGGCAICGRTESDATKPNLSVDHNHSTGKIRGLLCGKCNTALGKFQDSPELLRKAAEYVERAQ